MTFDVVLADVKVHVDAKFHQPKCSGSSVIVVTEKKSNQINKLSDNTENNTVIANAV